MLFVHESLAREAGCCELLERAIRDAWLDLRADREPLDRVISEILCDGNYLALLERFSGLCHLGRVHS